MLSRQRSELYTSPRNPACRIPDFHGACVILDNGIEIPITETMVRHSLDVIINEQARPLRPVAK